MKKKLPIAIVAITAALCCVFGFTACGGESGKTHTSHNWSSTYTEDGDRHYQKCDGCDEKNYSTHDYGVAGVCVCGKQKPEEAKTITIEDLLNDHAELATSFVENKARTTIVANKEVLSESVWISANSVNAIDSVTIAYTYKVDDTERAVEIAVATLSSPIKIVDIVDGKAVSVSVTVDRTTVFEFDASVNYKNQTLTSAIYAAGKADSSSMKLIKEVESPNASYKTFNFIEQTDDSIEINQATVRPKQLKKIFKIDTLVPFLLLTHTI